MQDSKNIFLIAGRTGGPFFPLPTISKNLIGINPIIIGIRGGFEDHVANQNNLEIHYLPDTRLTLWTFKTEKIREKIKNYLDLVKNLFLLFWSFLKSFYLLLKFKPKLIYSTGSFLAVPIIFSCGLTNFLRLTKTKIAVHQQDPEPGLANRLTAPRADFLSCVFQYTIDNFKIFKDAWLTPNPINTGLYENDETFENQELSNFVKPQSKSILLIFGGGSGSQDINLWALKYLDQLLINFRVVHLTGILQKDSLPEVKNQGYIRFQALLSDMSKILKQSDLVLCRAGIASITELLFLQKPTYLVPLPSTHQEKNAQLVSQYFYVLQQKDRPDWISKINSSFPKYFQKIKFPDKNTTKSDLQKYYTKIQSLID